MYHEFVSIKLPGRKQMNESIQVSVPVECYEVYEGVPFIQGESLQQIEERINKGEYKSVVVRFGNRREFNGLIIDAGPVGEASSMETVL